MKKPPRRAMAVLLAAASLALAAASGQKNGVDSALDGSNAALAVLQAELGQVQSRPLWEVLLMQELPEAAQQTQPVIALTPYEPPYVTEREQVSEPEPEQQTEPEPSQPQPEEVTEPESEQNSLDVSGVTRSDIAIVNHTEGISFNLKNYFGKTPELTLAPAAEGPQILIMHTHATEAYTMAGKDIYQESDESRTTDEQYNMIRIGEEMKAVFEAQGLSVVHDKTTYDYPGYNGSYGRSLKGIQGYLEQYPTIQIVLDVHRDAIIGADGTAYAKTAKINGDSTAQVMLVVGTSDSGLAHPDWRKQLRLAVSLQTAMLAVSPKLPRAIDLRSQRFNQHLTAGSLLVEVGTSGNTLREAIRGARLFAKAAGAVYLQCVK